MPVTPLATPPPVDVEPPPPPPHRCGCGRAIGDGDWVSGYRACHLCRRPRQRRTTLPTPRR